MDMLAAYTGSVEYLEEQRLTLGDGNPLAASSRDQEVLHLTRIFRTGRADRASTAAILKSLRGDSSNIFTVAQRKALAEAISTCVASAVDTDLVTDEMIGPKKEQTHMTSYSYYHEEMRLYCYFYRVPQLSLCLCVVGLFYVSCFVYSLYLACAIVLLRHPGDVDLSSERCDHQKEIREDD